MQSDFIEVRFSLSPNRTQSFTMQRKSSRRERISSVGRYFCVTDFTGSKSSENSGHAFKPPCPEELPGPKVLSSRNLAVSDANGSRIFLLGDSLRQYWRYHLLRHRGGKIVRLDGRRSRREEERDDFPRASG